MKILGILRHAKSDWDDVGQRDFDRGLNDRGRKGAAVIGQHIRDHGARWDAVLASPAVRVKQTLEVSLPEMEPVWDERLYLASVPTIFDVIRDHAGDADRVLISGHNPGLQEILFELIPTENENELFQQAIRKFPTASFAVLEIAIDDWANLDGAKATLAHFARPRDLDPELGPDTAR
ncbi:MAG: histidine phosphatase family protein [Sphingomonadaceae bacterium]|nr:histidine phosphatase family protein [Sphingomonadaceae bacterium]